MIKILFSVLLGLLISISVIFNPVYGDIAPPNITAQTPLEGTNFTVLGISNESNINFTFTCIDDVECSNGSLFIWYINNTLVNFSATVFPSYWNLTVGLGFSGTLEDTHQSDNVYLDIREESIDNGCLEAIFNFTGIVGNVEAGTLSVEGYYNGGAGHIVYISYRNFTSGEWVIFANASKETSDVIYNSEILKLDDITSNENVSIFFNHSDGGCISGHHFFLDEITGHSLAGDINFVDVSNGSTAGIVIGLGLGNYKYTWSATDNSSNSNYSVLGNYTFNIVSSRNMTITMSDLNIYSFNIPIINRFFTSNNQIVIYINGKYREIINTDGEVLLETGWIYTFALKPSKKGSLSSVSIFVEFLSYYYKIIFCIVIVLIVIIKIKRS